MLALSERVAPEFFERGQPISGTPYAEEIRKAMDELSIAGVFCNQGVPQIMILEQNAYDRVEVMRVHAALWNQGLANILMVSSGDVVRVFSLSRNPGGGDRSQFEDRCLIEAIDAVGNALALRDYVYGAESGRLWLEKAEYFDPRARIDNVLLGNLETAHSLLAAEGLQRDEAQAILIQTMFIAYLEDREVAASGYFETATSGRYDSLTALLGARDIEALRELFAMLQRDFNGDLFVAPCSFDDPADPPNLTPNAMHVLRRFREGKEEMTERGGQIRFWGYDFRFIPVELISAVYDRFLGYDPEQRSATGSYYTPMFLVDMTISSVWDRLSEATKDRGVFMDPACGSGIFLVRSFQRLCEHRRAARPSGTLQWKTLVAILNRVRGYDLNGGAVRVALFSLYIALLEEVAPPDIQALAKKGRLLPSLWGRTLVRGDFFDAVPEEARADVVVGNPPWTSRRNTQNRGLNWCKARSLPTPSGELAWAFVWKARAHVQDKGHVAFLLPAMGFLHNHAGNGVSARIRLFESVRMQSIINLSDLRRQLFDGAIHPTALMVFGTAAPDADYAFDYWTPKVDLNLRIRRFVTLSTIDKSRLKRSQVEANPLIFKQKLWLRGPEAKLFGHLDRLPKLASFVAEFGPTKRRNGDVSEGWMIGQGFQPYHAEASSISDRTFHDSDIVGRVPDLPVAALSPLVIAPQTLRPWKSSRLRRTGFQRAFTGSRVLYRRGIDTGAWRLRAAYAEGPLSFQHIVQAISAPDGGDSEAKFITAVLSSRLAVWFAFHGTSSFGAARPEVQQAELLRLPMPRPEDTVNPEAARGVVADVVALVNREQERASNLLRSPDEIEQTLREIDRLVYAYFGLSEEEVLLIEDTVRYVLPAVQPSSSAFPELWRSSEPDERAGYAERLIASLSDWFSGPKGISAELAGMNADFGIIQLRLTDAGDTTPYHERRDRSFTDVLNSLATKFGQLRSRNFQTLPDIRIFSENKLYMIKPMQKRFWLESSALADADAVASDLQSLTQTTHRESVRA
jgi:type I restriction-modification system DNA methylase subunit